MNLPTKNHQNKRVVVTGYGAISSLGSNTDTIWSSILSKKTGYDKVEFDNPDINARYFGYIQDKLDLSCIPKSIRKSLPRFATLGFLASHEAMQMSFATGSTVTDIYDPFDAGVIFGTGWGGYDSMLENELSYNTHGIASSFTNLQIMFSICTASISKHWQLRGYQNTPVAACATGSIAIGDAYEVIKSGRAKFMLAGGGESIKQPFNVWSVDVLQALSKEQNDSSKACCPFSLDRSGFVMSEGAAVLCLEELEGALNRNATILAELVGYGSYSDAFDFTAPAEDKLARVNAIKYACQESNLCASDFQYVNLHGTSTPLNDSNETEAVKQFFGNVAYEIPMSSTKSYTGHLIAAAGSLESILSIKTIETGILPATINLNNPDPVCDLNYIPNEHLYNQDVNTVLNLNFGFGGTNSALVFKRYGM